VHPDLGGLVVNPRPTEPVIVGTIGKGQ